MLSSLLIAFPAAAAPAAPAVADSRGLEFPEACGSRSSLLRVLVPALRVPLRLVEGGSEEAVRVEVPPNIDDLLQPQPRTGPPEV
jgi:hypothetical protein